MAGTLSEEVGFKGKVVVGVPHLRGLPGFFFDTMLSLSVPPGTRVLRVEDKGVDLARNMLVEGALSDPEVTHLFMVDADMILPADALLRLVAQDKDVISGTYFARSTPPIPHLYEFHHQDNADGSCPLGREHTDKDFGRWYRPLAREFASFVKAHDDMEQLVTVLPWTPDVLRPIDAAGAGCLLIKREVLEALAWPYFKCHERSGGGEDFYFCEQAKAAGFEVWGDFSVLCQHEYRGVFMDWDDFKTCFRIGEPDEDPFDTDLIVDMAPQQKVENLALREDSIAS